MVQPMFDKMETGKFDSAGKPILCGDRVRYYEQKPGYRETTAEDGWGRDIPLCRHDQRDIPPREKTIEGVVVYDTVFTGFVVRFDDYMLETGNKQQQLYILCGQWHPSMKHPTRLDVIG